MRKRNRILLFILIAVVATITLWGRAGALYWAKSSAKRWLNNLSPEVRRSLATTPNLIILPHPKLDAPLESAQLNSYILRFPRPETRSEKPQSMVLTYPRFRVLILPPFSLAQADAAARTLQFKDSFDLQSATHQARPEEIETQPDLASLKRHLVLLAGKMGFGSTIAQFDRTDLRGFITLDNRDGKRMVAELWIRAATNVGCGVTFIDEEGMSLTDVEEFLAALQLIPNPSPAPNPAATSPSARITQTPTSDRPRY
jgi:hypothetical protein